jgi:lysozyme
MIITDIYGQLRRDEGEKLRLYVDTKGKTTIGVGRNLTDDGISKDESDLMLKNDVGSSITKLYTRLPFFQALDAVTKGVLINMEFNMGFQKLEEFQKFLYAIAQGDNETASAELLNSLYAKEVGDRAVRLAQQVRTRVWV